MDDNIVLTTEEVQVDIPAMLEDFFPDDTTCISIKVNMDEYDASDNNFTPPCASSIYSYLADCGVKILAATAGIHLNGKNKIPHIHYHIMAEHHNPPSNPSQHRNRWLSKKDNHMENLTNATFKYQNLDKSKPVYQFLAYPLKEGISIPHRKRYNLYDSKPMSISMYNFLLSVGSTIYNTHLALRLRQDKVVERKQLQLTELYEICSQQSFNSYANMMKWLDDNYIAKLELNEYPDPKNYKSCCQKIGVKLGFLKYSEL